MVFLIDSMLYDSMWTSYLVPGTGTPLVTTPRTLYSTLVLYLLPGSVSHVGTIDAASCPTVSFVAYIPVLTVLAAAYRYVPSGDFHFFLLYFNFSSKPVYG